MQVQINGRQVPAQVVARSHWPDGSVAHALATWIGNKFSGFLGNVQNHMEPMWFFVFLAGLAAAVALFIFLVLPRLDRAIQKYGAYARIHSHGRLKNILHHVASMHPAGLGRRHGAIVLTGNQVQRRPELW